MAADNDHSIAEFDHTRSGDIERHPYGFAMLLVRYLNSRSELEAGLLERHYGVKFKRGEAK